MRSVCTTNERWHESELAIHFQKNIIQLYIGDNMLQKKLIMKENGRVDEMRESKSCHQTRFRKNVIMLNIKCQLSPIMGTRK